MHGNIPELAVIKVTARPYIRCEIIPAKSPGVLRDPLQTAPGGTRSLNCTALGQAVDN